jgi:hypothetical protein
VVKAAPKVSWRQKISAPAQKVFLSIPLLLPLFWLLHWDTVWTGSWQQGFAPLQTKIFEELISFLGNYRPLIPSISAPLILFVLSFAGLAALWAVAWLLLRSFNRTPWLTATFLALYIAFVFPLAAPGTHSERIFESLYFVFFLWIVTREPIRFSLLMAVILLGGFVAFITKAYSVFYFWVILSVVFAESLRFIFVDLLRTSKADRLRRGRLSLRVLSYLALALAVYFLMRQHPVSTAEIVPSSKLWLIVLSSALCLCLSALQTWRTSLWLRLGSLPFVLFFDHQAELFVVLLLAWLMIETLRVIQHEKIKIIPPAWLRISLYSISLILSCLWTAQHVKDFKWSRELEPEWVSTIKMINEQSQDPSKGFLILGNSLPLLSLFVRFPLVENLPIHLETSEMELLQILKQENLQAILIDREYLRRFWAANLSSGGDPNRINKSVFSRLLLHQGQAVKTETLELPEIEKFRLRESSLRHIVWIEPKV